MKILKEVNRSVSAERGIDVTSSDGVATTLSANEVNVSINKADQHIKMGLSRD